MFHFNIIIYLTIILSTVIGCDCTKLSQIDLYNCTGPKQDKGNPVIALFHGLGSSASCFDILINELKQAFPEADVVALRSVEGNKTGLHPIKEQAMLCFNDLLDKIPGLEHRPTFLIGHSQGGLRAYTMSDLYKDVLNVKGIVTLATPWEGAPIINAAKKLLTNPLEQLTVFKTDVLDDMRKFSISLSQGPNGLSDTLNSRLAEFQAGFKYQGVNDLTPGSPFLDQVKDRLPSETIPILAIGGAQSDFNVFLPKNSNHDFKALNEAWSKIVVGKAHHSKEHDMTVPLYSQLALSIVPKSNTNFKRHTIEDAIHDEILELPPNKRSKNILQHPNMFKEVEEFAKSVLYEPKANIQHEVKDAA